MSRRRASRILGETNSYIIEIRDETTRKSLTPIHVKTRAGKRCAIASIPGHRYSVTATIHAQGWDDDFVRADWVEVELLIDGMQMGVYGLERPHPRALQAGRSVSHKFYCTRRPQRRDFVFALRHDPQAPRVDVPKDDKVGKIVVTFRRARRRGPIFWHNYSSGRRKRRREDPEDQVAKRIKMDRETKDRSGVMRTRLGPSRAAYDDYRGGPRPYETIDVDDPICIAIVMYDTAENLRLKRYLRPEDNKKHRKWFPDEDWEKFDQRLKEITDVQVCNLCDSDGEGDWKVMKKAKYEARLAQEKEDLMSLPATPVQEIIDLTDSKDGEEEESEEESSDPFECY